MLKVDGVNLNFDKSAIDYIVSEASKKDVGARGLRGIVDKPMNILMFELPKYKNIKKMTITKELLDNPNKELEKIKNEAEKETTT